MSDNEALLEKALTNINKPMPSSTTECLYQTGFLDSFDLMQLLLEIEMASGKSLDALALIDQGFSLENLSKALTAAQDG